MMHKDFLLNVNIYTTFSFCYSIADVLGPSMQAPFPRPSPPVALRRREALGALHALGALRGHRPRQVAVAEFRARPAPQHLLVPPDAAQGQHAGFGGAQRRRRVPERRGRRDGRLHAREPAELRAGRETDGRRWQRRRQTTRR